MVVIHSGIVADHGGGNMQVRRGQQGYEILERSLKDLGKKVGKVGWFPSAKYEDGTPVAAIAAQNEEGNPDKHIPARPFFRPTITAKKNEWSKQIEKGARDVLLGRLTAFDVMDAVVILAASEVAETISKLLTPPLRPATIAARYRRLKKKTGVNAATLSKPLIDTGLMFNTLSGKVEDY